jgi:hypothetical protein
VPGATTIRTGSKAAIALATPAYSVSAKSNMPAHSSRRVGHAIRQASCGSHSAGMRHGPDGAAVGREDGSVKGSVDGPMEGSVEGAGGSIAASWH